MTRAAGTPTSRRKVGIGMLIAIVAFGVTRALVGPDPNALDEVPMEILGTWVTDDPRYADRAFIILPDEFHIQVGRDSVMPFAVREIRQTQEGDHRVYRVTYHTRAGQSVQEFRLYPDGNVRLRNPPEVVWTRR